MPKRSAETAHCTDRVSILLNNYPAGVDRWVVAIRTADQPNLGWDHCEYVDLCILVQYEDGPLDCCIGEQFMVDSKEVEHDVISPDTWMTHWDVTEVVNITQASIKALRIGEDCDSTMFYTMFMKCNRALGEVLFAADYFGCEKTLEHIRMIFLRRFMGSNAPYKRPIIQMFLQTKPNAEIIDDIVNFFRVKMGSKKNPLHRLHLFHIRDHKFIPAFVGAAIREGIPENRWMALNQAPNVFVAVGLA